MGRGPDKKPRKRRTKQELSLARKRTPGASKVKPAPSPPRSAVKVVPSSPPPLGSPTSREELAGGLDAVKSGLKSPVKLKANPVPPSLHKADLDSYTLYQTPTGYRVVYPVLGIAANAATALGAVRAAKHELLNQLERLKAQIAAELADKDIDNPNLFPDEEG